MFSPPARALAFGSPHGAGSRRFWPKKVYYGGWSRGHLGLESGKIDFNTISSMQKQIQRIPLNHEYRIEPAAGTGRRRLVVLGEGLIQLIHRGSWVLCSGVCQAGWEAGAWAPHSGPVGML